MENIEPRLVTCFQGVFPDLPETVIRHASQATVPAWDSVATITLLNVIDDEFQVLLDYERLAEFNSFRTINEFLEQSPSS